MGLYDVIVCVSWFICLIYELPTTRKLFPKFCGKIQLSYWRKFGQYRLWHLHPWARLLAQTVAQIPSSVIYILNALKPGISASSSYCSIKSIIRFKIILTSQEKLNFDQVIRTSDFFVRKYQIHRQQVIHTVKFTVISYIINDNRYYSFTVSLFKKNFESLCYF